MFLGEALLAYGRFFRGRGRFQWRDFWSIVQETGAQALPIVSLIAFLIGLILAFVGAVQLRPFGAQLYVADLVGIAMVDRKSVVLGKSVSVSVDLGGRRILKNKKLNTIKKL